MTDNITPAPLEGLPLFPLGTVLFPSGVLPLQIFEVRYLDMVRKCHRDGTPFGVVHLSAGHEVRKPGTTEVFSKFGTLAHIEQLDAPQPGLMMIRCVGMQRFRLSRSERLRHGLWVGDATPVPDDLPVPLPDDLRETSRTLQALMERLQDQLRTQREAAPSGDQGLQFMPWSGPWKFDECGWVANRWCELMRMPGQLKQQLLELENPLLRLELVNDLLTRPTREGTG